MHLVLQEGRVLSAPRPLGETPEDLEALAELYAWPEPVVRGEHAWVRAMMTTTLDGAVAGTDGTSATLHDPDDSLVFTLARALADVVLVGASTVRAEDYLAPNAHPGLLSPSRRPGGSALPVLAVLTRTGRLPEGLGEQWPLLLVAAPEDAERVRRGAADSLGQEPRPEQLVIAADPRAAVQELARRGLRGIQAEGGPTTLGRLMGTAGVDEMCLTLSHRTVGGSAQRLLDGPAQEDAWHLQHQLIGEHATLSRYRRPGIARSARS